MSLSIWISNSSLVLIVFNPRKAVRSEILQGWLHCYLYLQTVWHRQPLTDSFGADTPQKFPKLFQLNSLYFSSLNSSTFSISSYSRSRRGRSEVVWGVCLGGFAIFGMTTFDGLIWFERWTVTLVEELRLLNWVPVDLTSSSSWTFWGRCW